MALYKSFIIIIIIITIIVIITLRKSTKVNENCTEAQTLHTRPKNILANRRHVSTCI